MKNKNIKNSFEQMPTIEEISHFALISFKMRYFPTCYPKKKKIHKKNNARATQKTLSSHFPSVQLHFDFIKINITAVTTENQSEKKNHLLCFPCAAFIKKKKKAKLFYTYPLRRIPIYLVIVRE